ncbi:hypothetical protein VNO77_43763 [Canavalia gladiata]|uniref:Uncharacterized protein n=1 Tax=Canavalia gladiata TaxID=3824 RepID=A0AAN9JXC3_CANGL
MISFDASHAIGIKTIFTGPYNEIRNCPTNIANRKHHYISNHINIGHGCHVITAFTDLDSFFLYKLLV